MGRVVVIHPDLGVGGAERLIVDAARALKEKGHDVHIYTGHHDKNHCFKETVDGTLNVITIGQWIPRSICGRCHALVAYLKMIFIALYLIMFSKHDLVLCDQVSACIPILRLDFRNKAKIVFYCHFPDQLLTSRETIAKAIYRKPLDYFEELSTSAADIILVNSNFTSSVVKKTFKSLKNRNLTILYPCVDSRMYEKFESNREIINETSSVIDSLVRMSETRFIFLSINRFERKKNLELAITGLNQCCKLETQSGNVSESHLILAGGYDERLQDSVYYYEELQQLVDRLKLQAQVTFIKSPSDSEKLTLLHICNTVIYTPQNEHFGIVPLEAMAMCKPVIASASGGPLETIESGEDGTGFLCDNNDVAFAESMFRLLQNRDLCSEMGKRGRFRVKSKFSFEAFRESLNEICSPIG